MVTNRALESPCVMKSQWFPSLLCFGSPPPLYSPALNMAAAIHNTYVLEPTWVPHTRGTEKETVVYMHNGPFSYKDKQGSVLQRKMRAVEVITLSELRQSQEDKYYLCVSHSWVLDCP